MKPTVVIAIALLSFAAGWMLKPSGSAGGPEASADPSQGGGAKSGAGLSGNGRLDGKTRIREERPLVLKARGGGSIEPEDATVSAQMRFEETFGSAAERAEVARLSRLVEALGLSPEQRSTMAVLLANRRDGFRQLQGGGSNPADSIKQASVAEQHFMEDVKKLLDPEQVTALEDFKEREKANDIEAKAQRDLADLIGQIDLSEAQREQALEVMRQQSTNAASRRPAGWSLMNETMGMLGGSQVSVIEDLGEVMEDPSVMNDPQAVQRKLVDAQRASAEARIAALSSILTPGQLSQYRATLEARSAMMEQFTPPPVQPR
jgi:hypothetical protein